MGQPRMAMTILIVGVWLLAASARLDAAETPGAKQSVAGGGVTVDVTFLKERNEAPTFRVVLDTHSGSLDGYRFEAIVLLRNGQGSEIAPTSVEAVTGSGHHREATVRFPWPDPKPNSLEVLVKGVAGVPERVFRWTVQ